jgi:hypothetical protein
VPSRLRSSRLIRKSVHHEFGLVTILLLLVKFVLEYVWWLPGHAIGKLLVPVEAKFEHMANEANKQAVEELAKWSKN